MTRFFCSGVNGVAIALNWATIHPAPFFAAFGLILIFVLGLAHRTSWRPVNPKPMRQPRAGGQILGSARRLYVANFKTFVGIGLIYIPVSIVAGGVQWVLFHLTGIENFVALDGRLGVGAVFLAVLIGDIGGAVAAAAVTAAVAVALNELDAGRQIGPRQAYGLAARTARPLVGATVAQVVISLLLVLTVVGIPLAIYRFIRTSLYTQACVLEDRTALGSFRASRRLTGRQWWRTFVFTALVDILTILSGPILGVLVLLLLSKTLTFIDLTGSLIYALTVPYAAICADPLLLRPPEPCWGDRSLASARGTPAARCRQRNQS